MLLSDEHFTVDGTLLEAWAGMKSFTRRATPGRGAAAGRPRQSHREFSRRTTEQCDARVRRRTPTRSWYRRKARGREAQLAYSGYVLLDNRYGLVS